MPLAFLCGLVVLFLAVFAWEAEPEARRAAGQPSGLLRWITSGNWTAKLGAVLLTIGTGALLRYLMLNIELPPATKLTVGAGIAASLGVGSGILAARQRRRAVSLALAGAALAVAYLTAYSAYGFFHFIPDLQALGLLFIVAVVATVIAVARRALSIAVLAMVGAYLAPAFALHTTDPLSVYGYYVGASLVTLIMVTLRKWRPLIHLSFLFTLAGALFFGWTQKFYSPVYYSQMQPLLLALVGIHLAMPVLEVTSATATERGHGWVRRFDQVYFLLLPIVAAVLTLLIAPRIHREGAFGMVGLALLWAAAAGWQRVRAGEGSLRYLSVAALFLMVAGLVAITDVPLFLIAAVALCLLITAARWLSLGAGMERALTILALISSACYVLRALFETTQGAPLLNIPFAEHVLLGGALAAAGASLHRRDDPLAPIYLSYAATWLAVSFARELIRLRFDYVAQLAYLIVLAADAAYIVSVLVSHRRPAQWAVLGIGVALFGTAMIAATRFDQAYLIPLALAGQLLYAALAYQCDRGDDNDTSAGSVARSILPVLVFPFALAFKELHPSVHGDVVLTFLVASALFASLQAQWLVRETRVWPNWLSPVGFVGFGGALFYETLLDIERDPWDVTFELLALVYLLETARFLSISRNRDSWLFNCTAIAAVASVSSAMLLRAFGPPGTMTILALNDMLLPAILSLLWAAIGGLLTWLSTRYRSRTLWSLGAALLVAAALKLILFDFGSLGQIGNILATMGAGGVFLLVAWLAPFPPKRDDAPLPTDDLASPQATEQKTRSDRRTPPGVTAPSERSGTSSSADAGVKPRPDAVRAAASSGMADSSRGWLWVATALIVIALYGKWHSLLLSDRSDTLIPRKPPALLPEPKRSAAADRPLQPETAAGASTPDATPQTTDACRRFVGRLPAEYLVYAAGDPSDTPVLGMGPPAIRRQPTVDVQISAGAQNVVLALGAAEPTVWRVRRGGADHLVGVIVSGLYRSVVDGVPGNVPVLHAAAVDHAPCGYFQLGAATPQGANRFISSLLVHAVDGNFVPKNGQVTIGTETPDP